jgi:hypothetical protein
VRARPPKRNAYKPFPYFSNWGVDLLLSSAIILIYKKSFSIYGKDIDDDS